MSSKQHDKISMIVYENETIPYLKHINPRIYKFFLYGPTIISILAILVIVGAMMYVKNIEKLVRNKEPDIIKVLRTENSLLKEKADELTLLNKEFTKKISTQVDNTPLSTLYFISPVVGQNDLTNPAQVNIQDIKVESISDKLYFRFNIVNATTDGSKLAGYIHIFVTDGNTYQKYPTSVEELQNFSLRYTDGESFSTARFRPVEAIFKKMDRSTLIFKVIIFNRVGDLIHQQLHKEGLN